MSTINAIRLINLNYNHNTFRIGDETLFFNGNSTLLTLDNGGGKSVLIQMITALFVHKRYRSVVDRHRNRPFSDFFSSRTPTFLLVEWKLDQNAGYVLTGMMVRRNQNREDGNDEELEILNFISEYKDACPQDIHHLPVIEKRENGAFVKSFAVCRQLFEAYKKDKNQRFFCYDMNNSAQSRQYFDKLMEYRIYYREWENIIRKVNEEESGLSKLFADCKDERDLIEKWFLTVIESKLNRDQNRMQEFRSLLEKYIENYHRNHAKILRRDTILHFEQEAERIREQAEVCKAASKQCGEKRNEIAAYLAVLHGLEASAQQEIQKEQEKIEALSEKIRRTDHEHLSARYYETQAQLQDINEKIAALMTLLEKTEAKRKEWVQTLHVLQLAERQEQVDAARMEHETALQKLNICRKKGQDLQPERDYIGYRLRLYYEGQATDLHAELEKADHDARERQSSRQQAAEEIAQIDVSIKKAAQEHGSLTALVEAYDQEEQRFYQKWQVDLNRNLMGEYDPGYLQILADDLEREIADQKADRTAKKKQLEQTTDSIRKQERSLAQQEEARYSAIASRKSAEEQLNRYETELQERRTIIKYLELREDVLFQKDHILSASDGKLKDLDMLIEKMRIEAEEIRTEISNLTTGQMIEISPEMRSLFDTLGIPVVYGMEWMQKNGQSEEANLELVEQNPFLPYALIMTQSEFQRLMKSDLRVYTGSPIPIVTREALKDTSFPGNGMEDALYGVHFYMLFNRNLLNKEKLAAHIFQRQKELEKKEEGIARKRAEYQEYVERRAKIAGQTVTKGLYEGAREAIDEWDATLQKIKTAYAAISAELTDLRSERDALMHSIEALSDALKEREQKKEDLRFLTQAYEIYRNNRTMLTQCKEQLASLEQKKKRTQSLSRQLDEELQLLLEKRTELNAQIESIRKDALAYAAYQKVPEPAAFSKKLLADHAALLARYTAITERVSHEVQELEEAERRSAERLKEAENGLVHQARKYQMAPSMWSGTRYRVSEADHAEMMIDSIQREYAAKIEEQHRLEIEEAKLKESANHILESMERECHEQAPLPREEIHVTDYMEKKSLLQSEQVRSENEAERLRNKVILFAANLNTLAQYEDTVATSPVSFETDFSRYGESEFRSFTGGLLREYSTREKDVSEQEAKLEKIIHQILRMEEFKEDYYQKPLETLLSLTGDADQVLKQLDVVLQSYHDLIEKLLVDIAVVEKEHEQIVAVILEYVAQIHDQMGKIDRNSSIPIRGKSLKLLKIALPVWAENDAIYRKRMEDFIDALTTKGLALLAKGETIHEFIGNRLTTKELYDGVIGISNVHIQLYKIEEQRELPISWKDVSTNSGGESFLSAFIILSNLLYYTRRDDTELFADRNEGKVLLMDNPFAQTNAAHLLKPMTDIASKNNTQLICLTALGEESIYNQFDNIYVLKLVPSMLDNAQHLRAEHKSGDKPQIVSAAHFEVSDNEQMELMF